MSQTSVIKEEPKNVHKKAMSLKQIIKNIPKSTKNGSLNLNVTQKNPRQIPPPPLMALRLQY